MPLEDQTGDLRPAVIAGADDGSVRNNSAGVLTSVYILLRSTSNVSKAFVAAFFCMGMHTLRQLHLSIRAACSSNICSQHYTNILTNPVPPAPACSFLS